jgi:hypothetical protein
VFRPSPAHTARDRGVHEPEAGGSGGVVQCLRGSYIDGGGIHQQCPGVGVRKDAVPAQVHGTGVLALRQHGEHDVGPVHRFGDARHGLHAAGFGSRDRSGIEVEAADIVPCLGQVG